MASEAFQTFLAQVQKYPGMWDSIRLEVVAAKKGDIFYLLGLRGTLSLGEVEGTDILFTTPEILLLRENRKASHLPQLLASLDQGAADLGNTSMQVDGFEHWQCQEFAGGGQGWVGVSYPHTMLHSGGKPVHQIVDQASIDRRLPSWAYHSLWELCRDTLGFPIGGAYSTQIQLVMPIYVEASTAFVGDDLHIEVRYHCSLLLEDLRASYAFAGRTQGRQVPERGQVRFSQTRAPEGQVDFYSASVDKTSPAGATGATVHVFHRTREDPMYTLHVVKQATARSNPVVAAMKLLVTRREKGGVQGCEMNLHQALGLEKGERDATKLEIASQNLMACAGYACLFIGKAWGTQGIDLLAFSRDFTRCFAISVTTSNNIGEKIRTLLPQRKKLEAELEGLTLIPLILAPVDYDEVMNSDRQNAKEHNIGLVLRPELDDLLTNAMTLPMQEMGASIESIVSRNLEDLGKRRLGLGQDGASGL